jgi:plastocyanin
MSRTTVAAPATNRRTARIRRVCAGGVAAVAVLAASAACGNSPSHPGGGNSTSSGTGNSASSGTGTSVEVKNFAFSPAALSVPVGAKVTWTFDDAAQHTVKADDGSFSSAPLNNGKTYSFTFNKAGAYHYICTIHQYMTGTITVR